MSAEWNGNLLNDSSDVGVDVTILLLIVCAYIPQVLRIHHFASTDGISTSYILLDSLSCNIQLGHALPCAAFAWPTSRRPVLDQIRDGALSGLRALGSVLGHLQMSAHWLCSVVLLIQYSAMAHDRILFIWPVTLIHTLVFMLIPAYIALAKATKHDYATDIFLGILQMSNFAITPCLIILQFLMQLCQNKLNNGNPGALSLLSIGLKMLAFAALSIRWLLRTGSPTWGRLPAPIWLWYSWAFPAANYALQAVSAGLILASYC